MPTSIYVNGVDATNYTKIDSIEFEVETNAQANLEFDFLDTAGLIRPDLANYVVYTRNERTLTVTVTSGNPVVTVSSAFTIADDQRVMVIPGAGPGGSELTSIVSYISGSQVSLEFAPSTSVGPVVARLGDRKFSGFVSNTEEKAFYADSGIEMRLTVSDWNERIARQLINAPYVGQTLKAIVTHVYNSVLASTGLRLDPNLSTGPTIDYVGFAFSYIDEVFNHLSKLTGWIWRADHTGVLRFFAPGTVAAPYQITTDIVLEGTFRKSRTFNEYRNVQWMWIGGSAVRDLAIPFTGNGVIRRFAVDSGITTINTPPCGTVRVTYNPGDLWSDQPVGIYGVDALEWTWDTATREFVHTGGTVLGSDDTMVATCSVQYPIALVEADVPQIIARGSYVRIDRNDSIFSLVEGHEYGAALIRRYTPLPFRINFDTYAEGFMPGQTAEVNMENRGIENEQYLIQTVEGDDDGAGGIVYAVTAIEGDEFQGTWIDFFKEDTVGGAGSVSYSPAPGGGVSGGGSGTGGSTGAIIIRSPLGGHDGSYVVAASTDWHDIAQHIDIALAKNTLPVGTNLFVRVHIKMNVNGTIQAGLRNTSTGGIVTVGEGNILTNMLSYTYDGFYVYIEPIEQIYRVVVRTNTIGARMYCWKSFIESR